MSPEIAYRDFIYLDTDRVQSILAQLQQGLITELTQGELSQDGENLGAKAGISIFQVSGGIDQKRVLDLKESRVLHDYAYAEALRSLREQEFLIETIEGLDRDANPFPVPEDAFVLVTGSARILDYTSFGSMADSYKKLGPMLPDAVDSQQAEEHITHNRAERRRTERSRRRGMQGVPNQDHSAAEHDDAFDQMKQFADAFYKDVTQVHVTTDTGINFIGELNREFIRENIRNLIFKYGSEPQGLWSMLCQVTRIPSPRADSEEDTLEGAMATAVEPLSADETDTYRSITDFMNSFLNTFNRLQEAIISVRHPNVLVSPIAVYREIVPIR